MGLLGTLAYITLEYSSFHFLVHYPLYNPYITPYFYGVTGDPSLQEPPPPSAAAEIAGASFATKAGPKGGGSGLMGFGSELEAGGDLTRHAKAHCKSQLGANVTNNTGRKYE